MDSVIQVSNLAKIAQYKSILGIYAGKGKRDWLKTPFIIDENIYSSDEHCMVFFSKNIINDLSNYPVFDKSKIGTIIPTITNKNKIISLGEINAALSKCLTKDDYDEIGEDVVCKECQGESVVEWEYNGHTKEFDCPICDGEGLSRKKRSVLNGKKVFDDDSMIKLGMCHISAKIIESIANITTILNEEYILLTNQTDPHKINLFKIGDVSLLVMPMLTPNEHDNIAAYIDINS